MAHTLDPTPTCETCHDRKWLGYNVPLTSPLFGQITPCPACTPISSHSLDNYDPLWHPTCAVALRLAQAFPAPERPWLALSGPWGTGKTHLLEGIAGRMVRGGKLYSSIVANELLQTIRDGFSLEGDARRELESELRRMLHQPWPLLIDDFGAGQSLTPWVWDQMDNLLCDRYNPPLPTLLTTNLSRAQLAEKIPRAMSRLSEVGIWCPIDAIDHRDAPA